MMGARLRGHDGVFVIPAKAGIQTKRRFVRGANMRQPDRASESRLAALREEAARTGEAKGGGVVPSGAPFPRPANEQGYYGIPLLKEPTWTWQVPLYFFVGGAAGASTVIGFVAHVFGSDPGLACSALWIALGGALLCPSLLIAAFGRPARFLNMLLVCKFCPPISVGVVRF